MWSSDILFLTVPGLLSWIAQHIQSGTFPCSKCLSFMSHFNNWMTGWGTGWVKGMTFITGDTKVYTTHATWRMTVCTSMSDLWQPTGAVYGVHWSKTPTTDSLLAKQNSPFQVNARKSMTLSCKDCVFTAGLKRLAQNDSTYRRRISGSHHT